MINGFRSELNDIIIEGEQFDGYGFQLNPVIQLAIMRKVLYFYYTHTMRRNKTKPKKFIHFYRKIIVNCNCREHFWNCNLIHELLHSILNVKIVSRSFEVKQNKKKINFEIKCYFLCCYFW